MAGNGLDPRALVGRRRLREGPGEGANAVWRDGRDGGRVEAAAEGQGQPCRLVAGHLFSDGSLQAVQEVVRDLLRPAISSGRQAPEAPVRLDALPGFGDVETMRRRKLPDVAEEAPLTGTEPEAEEAGGGGLVEVAGDGVVGEDRGRLAGRDEEGRREEVVDRMVAQVIAGDGQPAAARIGDHQGEGTARVGQPVVVLVAAPGEHRLNANRLEAMRSSARGLAGGNAEPAEPARHRDHPSRPRIGPRAVRIRRGGPVPHRDAERAPTVRGDFVAVEGEGLREAMEPARVDRRPVAMKDADEGAQSATGSISGSASAPGWGPVGAERLRLSAQTAPRVHDVRAAKTGHLGEAPVALEERRPIGEPRPRFEERAGRRARAVSGCRARSPSLPRFGWFHRSPLPSVTRYRKI